MISPTNQFAKPTFVSLGDSKKRASTDLPSDIFWFDPHPPLTALYESHFSFLFPFNYKCIACDFTHPFRAIGNDLS